MTGLGTRLRQLRDKHKLSETEVANYIGIEQSTYSRKESDLSEFKANELVKLAELYKLPIQDLFPSSYLQIQENKDNANHFGFIYYSSEKEVALLQEQNSLLKENATLLKNKIQELELKVAALSRN